MEEIWKPIEGFENYLVSNTGKILNNKTKRLIGTPISKGKHKGYVRVALYKNGKRHMFMAHVLVAKHFIPNPENKPTVNHIDGNKSNNNVTNLEWASYSEQMEHARRNGLRTKGMLKEEIEEALKENLDYIEIMNKYKVSESYARKIASKNGIIQKHHYYKHKIKSKTGIRNIQYYPKLRKYRVRIFCGKTKIIDKLFTNLDDAIKARDEAQNLLNVKVIK